MVGPCHSQWIILYKTSADGVITGGRVQVCPIILAVKFPLSPWEPGEAFYHQEGSYWSVFLSAWAYVTHLSPPLIDLCAAVFNHLLFTPLVNHPGVMRMAKHTAPENRQMRSRAVYLPHIQPGVASTHSSTQGQRAVELRNRMNNSGLWRQAW